MELEEMLQDICEDTPFDEFYRKNVRLEVHHLGEGDTQFEPAEVQLKYKLNLENKSWGVASIELLPVGTISFDITFANVEQAKEITVNFDEVKELHMILQSGKVLAPEILEVTLDKSFQIVDVSLYATFVDPS